MLLPFVVSGALLIWVLSGVDVNTVLAHLTPSVAVLFVPALLVFLVVSLVIEALCLVLVVSHSRPFRDLVVAARIKAASYPLGLVNYALGAGGTAVLLSRRASMTLAEAAGSVFVIGALRPRLSDRLRTGGRGLMGAQTPGLQAGVVVLVGGAIVAGFAGLRAPVRMGMLDRLRDPRDLAGRANPPDPAARAARPAQTRLRGQLHRPRLGDPPRLRRPRSAPGSGGQYQCAAAGLGPADRGRGPRNRSGDLRGGLRALRRARDPCWPPPSPSRSD